MEVLSSMCRVCLTSNVRMHSIINIQPQLQQTYKKLVGNNSVTQFKYMAKNTEVELLTKLCYICYAQLWKSHKFSNMAIESEKFIRNKLKSGIEVTLKAIQNLERKQNLSVCALWPLSVGISVTEEVVVKDEILSEDEDYIYYDYVLPETDLEKEVLEDNVADQAVEEEHLVDVFLEHAIRMMANHDHCYETSETLKSNLEKKVLNENVREAWEEENLSVDFVKEENIISEDNLYDTCGISETNCAKEELEKNVSNEAEEKINLDFIKDENIMIINDNNLYDTCDIPDNVRQKDVLEENVTEGEEKENTVDFVNERLKIQEEPTVIRSSHQKMKYYYCCDVCNKRFISKKYLAEHYINHAEDINAISSSFMYKKRIGLDLNKQQMKKLHHCEACDKTFSSRIILYKHNVNVHGGKPYACNVCNKTFSIKALLTKHSRIHTENKQYVCDICDKCFDDKTTLNNHIKLHARDKPHNCFGCDKTFETKKEFVDHVNSNMKAQLYVCNICSKGYIRKRYLKSHIQSDHCAQKPICKKHICDNCGKIFINKEYLIVHMKTHAEPFACYICKNLFRERFILSNHMKTHEGEILYNCAICNQDFCKPSSLNVHMKDHFD